MQQWSATTCERISALEMRMAAEREEATKAATQLKIAIESRDESELGIHGAIREAMAQHKSDEAWPSEVAEKISGFAADLERRERTVREHERFKKGHLKEADRFQERLFSVIREAREGQNIFDATASTANAWRMVQLDDIGPKQLADIFVEHKIVSVGDVIEAANDGRLETLLVDKVIAQPVVAMMLTHVRSYLKARGIEQSIAGPDTPDPEPDTPPAEEPTTPPDPTTTEEPKTDAALAHDFLESTTDAEVCSICGHGKDWQLHGLAANEAGGA